ncbi:shikimate dehydrogenase [Agromyces mediolanus]|uniref:shikimate dehydrogenase n=1 Tax=Agromyces mediolanus TaxID=41986 RepID=UPI002041DFB5|nr:shikimate dehydrogenase [Agromyces mediolanus]MCM3657028.1 shikimate dehydrogenase [Agromyces mediolanus]
MTAVNASQPHRLAVLGSPIAHSKSPALHRAAYRALGLDWQYEAVEVASSGLAEFVGSRDASWRGLSLTMPLKQEVLPLVDELDRRARLTGAANTLRFDRGRRLGFNTDVGGIVGALADAGTTQSSRAGVVGGGATAASAIAAIAELGASEVEVFVRTPARAAALEPLAASLGLRVLVRRLDELSGAEGLDLVVATVPGGTELGVQPSAALTAQATLLEVAYDPWPSPLATRWLDAGGTVVHGLGMLLHQALLQVRVFANGDPEQALPGEDEVLAAMRAAIA